MACSGAGILPFNVCIIGHTQNIHSRIIYYVASLTYRCIRRTKLNRRKYAANKMPPLVKITMTQNSGVETCCIS